MFQNKKNDSKQLYSFAFNEILLYFFFFPSNNFEPGLHLQFLILLYNAMFPIIIIFYFNWRHKIQPSPPPMMAADCVVLMRGSVLSYASLGT